MVVLTPFSRGRSLADEGRALQDEGMAGIKCKSFFKGDKSLHLSFPLCPGGIQENCM